MIISIEWLKKFVEIEESPEELAELLSKAGLESETRRSIFHSWCCISKDRKYKNTSQCR